MTSVAIPVWSAAQSQSREWITPQEQLDRLCNYHPKSLASEISESPLFPRDRYDHHTRLGIANIVSQYLVEPLSPDLTDWYTSLQSRGALPDKVPALPPNIRQFLDSTCPIWGHEQKPDGAHCTYLDKWVLSLKVPETINEMEASVRAYGGQVLNAQGERLYPDENPLQFRFFLEAARQKHANVLSHPEPYWFLHTKTVAPRSKNQALRRQLEMVAELRKKVGIGYEVPSLGETLTTYFNRKIARGESLFDADPNEELNGFQRYTRRTYTRVKETAESYGLIVGASLPSGVSVTITDANEDPTIGMAFVLKLNDERYTHG